MSLYIFRCIGNDLENSVFTGKTSAYVKCFLICVGSAAEEYPAMHRAADSAGKSLPHYPLNTFGISPYTYRKEQLISGVRGPHSPYPHRTFGG